MMRILVFCWISFLAAGRLIAAEAGPDGTQFEAAAKAFQDGFYDRAARELDEFAAQHPDSGRLPEAILMQAQTRYFLGQFETAINLLNANYSAAGKWADQYRLWMGECQLKNGNPAAAAALYAQLLADFPASTLRTRACYSEAYSWFKLGNASNAVERLVRASGAFQKMAVKQPEDEYIQRGFLLLAEACLAQKQYRAAETVLQDLAARKLPPQLAWERLFLLASVQLADQRAAAAAAGLTNLLSAATAAGSPVSRAKSILLQGQIWVALNDAVRARQIYEQNLADLPVAERREAIWRLINLNLITANATGAIQYLELFIKNFPQDPEQDRARINLGELRLNEHGLMKAGLPAGINLTNLNQGPLWQALTNLDFVITNLPQSGLLGQAYYHRGWCCWEARQWKESAAAFAEAVQKLRTSPMHALARMKLADASFEQGEATNALRHYQLFLAQYGSQASTPSNWLEHALYQVTKASIATSDTVALETALDQLLTQYPTSSNCPPALLQAGQAYAKLGQMEQARSKYAELLNRYPHCDLIPENRLAIARSFIRESKWAEAAKILDHWVTLYTNHTSLPKVEFDRAWIQDQAGRETNALVLFTNYVTRFPQSQLAPAAQLWVGDFFYNQGQFAEAEQRYQALYENKEWRTHPLAARARLAAGRAAFARQGYNNAHKYFTELINLLITDTNSSQALLSEAYLAFGDTLIALTSADLPALSSSTQYGKAIVAFGKVPEGDPLAPRAWGRLADCYFQLAAREPARYEQATNYYLKIIESPLADIECRSNAEVGLGAVLEKLADRSPTEKTACMQGALSHYLNVVYEKNLRDGEQSNAFWKARAGLAAGLILELNQQWKEAVELYSRLLAELPGGLRASLQRRLDAALKKS